MKKLVIVFLCAAVVFMQAENIFASAEALAKMEAKIAVVNAIPGTMVVGCCQSDQEIASQMALRMATEMEIAAMEDWLESNEKAITAAANGINTALQMGTQSGNQSVSLNFQGQMIGESVIKNTDKLIWGLAAIDKACLADINYDWIKARDAVRAAASQMAQYQRNILLGLTPDNKDVVKAQAERADVAKKQAVPYADLTLTPKQAEGVQAFIDLFYTANIPDPDPATTGEKSQDAAMFAKEKQKYIFTQLFAAEPMNRWLAGRTPIVPAKEVNEFLEFYSLEPPTTTDFSINPSTGRINPDAAPKPIPSSGLMSQEAVLDGIVKVFLSDQFQNEALDSDRQLLNILKVDAVNTNMLFQIKNSLESSNVLLSMMVGLLNERQFAKINGVTR